MVLMIGDFQKPAGTDSGLIKGQRTTGRKRTRDRIHSCEATERGGARWQLECAVLFMEGDTGKGDGAKGTAQSLKT